MFVLIDDARYIPVHRIVDVARYPDRRLNRVNITLKPAGRLEAVERYTTEYDTFEDVIAKIEIAIDEVEVNIDDHIDDHDINETVDLSECP